MKKLGTLALGALLFFAVSCDKNKTSLAPSAEKNSATYTVEPPKNDGGDNDEVINPGSMMGKEDLTRNGVRNDEEINSDINTDRIAKPVRNDMIDPKGDPRRNPRIVRNDFQNPYNDHE